MTANTNNPVFNTVIAYGSHDLQKIKVFNYSPENKSTCIYIHGGAWRDPSNTFDEMEPVVKYNERVNHIGINYRLSPEIKHPEHLIDVARALRFIKENFQVEGITLSGHSIGATMILQLLHLRIIVNDGLKYLDDQTCSNNDVDKLLDYVETNIKFEQLLFFDGIYDIVELLKEYSDYSSFVNDAFINSGHFTDATQLSSRNDQLSTPFSLVSKNTKFLIYQSLEDELLSMKQTQLLVNYYASRSQQFNLYVGNWGKHEEIYRNNRESVFHGESPKFE